MEEDKFYCHVSSFIDKGASIGEGTKVWHFCHIMGKAKIGKGCVIGQNVFIADDVIIGDNVKIQNNVSLYTGVIIEDDVFLGPSMVLTNVKNPRSFIDRKVEFRPTIIKKGASIGANATLVCGTTVGDYSFIGAGAVVTKNIPAYSLYYGVPATFRSWVCQCGNELKTSNDVDFFCPFCKSHYKLQAGVIEPDNESK